MLTYRQNWVSDWLGLKPGPPLYILLSLKWNGHSIWWLLPLCSSYKKQLQQASRVYSNEVYALFFHLCTSLPLCSFMHYCFVRWKEYSISGSESRAIVLQGSVNSIDTIVTVKTRVKKTWPFIFALWPLDCIAKRLLIIWLWWLLEWHALVLVTSRAAMFTFPVDMMYIRTMKI